MMEKKAKECKLWKLRACKAERELKLMMNILQPSQLEELQKQNVCDESLSLSNYTSADSSLESCYHTSLGKPHDSGSHVVYVPELKEQRRVSDNTLNAELLAVIITITFSTDYLR